MTKEQIENRISKLESDYKKGKIGFEECQRQQSLLYYKLEVMKKRQEHRSDHYNQQDTYSTMMNH